ncbi:hypothetical protein FGG78_34765 [Thioclava sp. BHET1]|nr:hypothetical protein FGG78_34765 [Thioclava sp. BHET1]
MIYAHWPSPVEVSGNAVTIADPIPQSWIPAPSPVPPLAASDFQQLVAATYVGVLKSVSARQGATGAAVSVTINAGFGDAFARFERLKGAQLLSIREENGMTTVEIAPAAPVLRPVQKPGTHPEKG